MRSLLRTFAPLSLVFFLLSLDCHSAESRVTRVIDGDTLKVRGSSGEITVRLVGIDAPEVSHNKNKPGQPFSQ